MLLELEAREGAASVRGVCVLVSLGFVWISSARVCVSNTGNTKGIFIYFY